MTDTFPRQYARTQRFTLGEPRNSRCRPTASASCSSAARRRAIRSTACGCSTSATGDERLVADPRRAARRRATTTDLPAEERARRERAREGGRRRRRLRHRRGGHGRRLRPRRAAVRRRAGLGVGPRARRRRPGVRSAPRSDGPPRRLRQRRRAAHRRARRHELGSSPATTTIPTCRGARPSSSPPRRWAATAATGGRPTATARRRPRRHLAGRPLVDRRPGPPRRAPPTEIAYPAAGTDNADVTLHVLGLDGGRVEVEWDRERFPYLAAVRWARRPARCSSPSSRATSADLAGARRRPDDRATTHARSPTPTSAWVELVPGTPGGARRRSAGDGRRPRRRAAPAGRRRGR